MIEQVLQKFTPVGTFILCQPILAAEKTQGGILIPEQARNPLNQGKILAIGDALSHADWHEFDTVMWTAHSEYKLTLDGAEFILVSVENIILRTKR